MLLDPVVLLANAQYPSAMLFDPYVLAAKLHKPIATLCTPVVSAPKLFIPTAVLPLVVLQPTTSGTTTFPQILIAIFAPSELGYQSYLS
jgi:hypothetical protein